MRQSAIQRPAAHRCGYRGVSVTVAITHIDMVIIPGVSVCLGRLLLQDDLYSDDDVQLNGEVRLSLE